MRKAGISSLTLVALGCALVARYLPFANRLVAGAAVMVPHLTAVGPLASLSFLIRRRWLLAGAAAATTGIAAATQVPLFFSDGESAGAFQVRLMTANLLHGAVLGEVLVTNARTRADVLAVQELTGEELDRLTRAGLDSEFPHRAADPHPGTGLAVWSRYPISECRRIDGFFRPLLAIKIRIEGVDKDPAVVVVHPPSPWYINHWRHDISRLPAAFREVDEWAAEGAVMVAGDFNSTLDIRPFREVLRHGYRDAADQAGAGLTATFPAGHRWLPPLIAIDHILTLRCSAATVRTVTIPGSDHRALAATIKLRTPPR